MQFVFPKNDFDHQRYFFLAAFAKRAFGLARLCIRVFAAPFTTSVSSTSIRVGFAVAGANRWVRDPRMISFVPPRLFAAFAGPQAGEAQPVFKPSNLR